MAKYRLGRARETLIDLNAAVAARCVRAAGSGEHRRRKRLVVGEGSHPLLEWQVALLARLSHFYENVTSRIISFGQVERPRPRVYVTDAYLVHPSNSDD